MVEPYRPRLQAQATREGGDVEALVRHQLDDCVRRMRTLYSTAPKDYAWQVACLAKAKTIDAVEVCRGKPRPHRVRPQ